MFRKPAALAALKQIWNGTTVYVGDNPIARKMRLHLLQPSTIPGARPGTVQLPADVHECTSTTLLAQGVSRGSNDERPHSDPSPSASPLPAQQDKQHISNVIVKVTRNLQSRPTLANSMMESITCVKRNTADLQPTVWETEGDASEKIQQMFDEIQRDMENWKQLESVAEETPSVLGENTCEQAVSATEIEAGIFRTAQAPRDAAVCPRNTRWY